MKITDTTLEVTRSGSFQERGFQIAGNAKAFDILSSKMYTNIIRAIVRELSTNASDSHIESGCTDKPFDVHLPNALEPWFMIRDYGTGLSPEDVETVYTTYFKSTRSGSDDFTGCLGLGSKSPFAYTDQFTIVSNWNGRKYTYSAYKNEQNCPTLALLSEIDTDEANGLEIRLNIKPGDAYRFVQEAQFVYQFFKVRPNIVGAQVNFEQLNAELETPEFALYTNGGGVFHSRINVVMGQVCYAVGNGKISNPFGMNAVVVLHVPMGHCSIAASREEVHYDQRTIDNLSNSLHAAVTHAQQEFEGRVANEGSLLHKLAALAKYRHLIGGLSIKGTTHIESNEANKYALKDCMIKRGDKLFMHASYTEFRPGEYMERLVFIEEDAEMTQNMKNRLRQYMRTMQGSKFYLATIKDQARFEELFGAVATKLSLLPDVPRVPRDTSRATSRSKPIKLLRDTYDSNVSMAWENIHAASEIDATDACCVIRDGNWIIWNGQRVKPEQIRILAKTLGFKRVYGIAEKRYETSRIKNGIVELSAVAKDRAEKTIAGLDTYALSRFQHRSKWDNGYMDIKQFAGLSQECDDMIKVSESETDNMQTYMQLARMFDIQIPTAPDYQTAFFEKYPILLAVDCYNGKMYMEHVINYIKLIEANASKKI